MTDLKSIPSHSPKVVTRKTGNEYVLVPVSNNIANMNNVFTLNETGAFIWDQIDGVKSIEEIIAALVSEYDIEMSAASSDVFSFLKKMCDYLVIEQVKK
jgi:hypothetical protein